MLFLLPSWIWIGQLTEFLSTELSVWRSRFDSWNFINIWKYRVWLGLHTHETYSNSKYSLFSLLINKIDPEYLLTLVYFMVFINYLWNQDFIDIKDDKKRKVFLAFLLLVMSCKRSRSTNISWCFTKDLPRLNLSFDIFSLSCNVNY